MAHALVDEQQRALTERDARIAALEAELERLRPPPPPVPTLDGPFRPPNREQTARLIQIVSTQFPCLRPPKDDNGDNDFILNP
jgi:hypothetical protein